MHLDSVVIERVATSAPAKTRLRLLAWACALLPFVALALWCARQGTGLDGDDFGQYLMHARAIVEGRPYSDIGYIYSSYARWIGPRAAPPGLPLVLAAVQMVFGPSMAIMKLVMICFAIAFVLFSALYFARESGVRIGWGVALLCGLSPAMVQHASQFLTDLPFAAVIWGIIYLMDRPGLFSNRKIVAVTFLGVFAVMLRPTGIALGGAVLLYAVVHYRKQGIRPAIPFIIWSVGLLILAVVADIDRTAVIQIDPRAVLDWILVEKLPLVNMNAYANAVLSSHLYPFPWDALNDVFHGVTAILMVIGLMTWLRVAASRFAVLFAVCYSAMLLIMPLNQPRYAWPLFPFFVFGLLNGIRVVAGYFMKSSIRASAFALGFAIALTPLVTAHVLAQPAAIDLADIPEIREVFDYVQTTAAHEPMRVTFFKPRTLAWATGVAAMGPPRGRPECLILELRRKEITHVIVGSLGGMQNSNLRRAISLWPALFQKRLENGIFTVYQFRPNVADMRIPPDCP